MALNSVMFLLGLSLLVLGANGKVVDFIDPCPINDDACVLTSAKKVLPHIINGNEQLKIKSFDPIFIPTLNGDIGELKISFDNLTVNGASKCELIEVKRPEELKVYVEVVCPISADGKYKANGTLLEYVVYGHGPFSFETDKMRLTATVFMKVIDGKDGKKYYKIHKFDFSYNPEGDVKMSLKNLYDGDDKKAEPIYNLIATSAKELVSTIGKNVIQKVISVVVDVIRDVIVQIPLEEFNG